MFIEYMGTHIRSISEQMEKFVSKDGVKIVAKYINNVTRKAI